jgi:hypothetical protein
MNSMRPFYWMICLTLLLPMASVAQSVTSYAIPDTLSSGDTFDFVITSSYQSNTYTAIYPTADAFSGSFEFRGTQRFRGVLAQDSIVYRLQYFGVRDTVLAGLNVHFVQNGDTLTLESAPVSLFFRSKLESESDELKPFKPIFDFTRSWWMLILVGILLAVGAYLIWKYRDRFMSKAPSPEPVQSIPIPPYVGPFTVFEKSLRELKSIQNYGYEDGLKQWHVGLSEAIRTYIEHTHGIDALEMTTRETYHAIQKANMHPDVVTITYDILKQCDLVKFAKVSVDAHQSLILLEKAEKLRDLFRFMDESRLKELMYQYEMMHGLRREKSALNGNIENDNELHTEENHFLAKGES